jgi:predicted metal-dependent TIM-barrel fold hydrolase
MLELADRGALIERCFTTAHTGKVTWERWLEATRAVGAARCVLASDLGQVGNPPVEDGLALLADRLLEAGFTEAEVRTMAVANTRRVAGAEPL